MYKTVDLFGHESVQLANKTRKRPNLFSDHDAFVEKFEVKKTTDDCYTPPAVFQLVLDYVNEKCNLEGKTIIRPFFPGGDFEAIEYPENGVVIDNPPFSIISKIVRFYLSEGVPFFLFAPHLTLFSSDVDCTHIVVGGNILYENGATIKTSFLSNMFGEAKVIGDAALYQKFKQLEASQKNPLPKYEYPGNVVTVSGISFIVEKGISIKIDKKDAQGTGFSKTTRQNHFWQRVPYFRISGSRESGSRESGSRESGSRESLYNGLGTIRERKADYTIAWIAFWLTLLRL